MHTGLPRIVVDTNVLFEGLTRQGGAAGLIVDAWLVQLLKVYISTALAYEYADVLGRKLSPARWQNVRLVLDTLLRQARFTDIYYRWRPISPDPGDDKVIDCAMNAGAAIVTFNMRDFRVAKETIGIQVFTPVALAKLLAGVD